MSDEKRNTVGHERGGLFLDIRPPVPERGEKSGERKMLEKDVEAKLARGVKALGGVCYKFVSPGTVGVPDRIAVFPGGEVCFIELKTERGHTRPAQDLQIAKLRGVGASVVVLHGPGEVSEFLEMRRIRKIRKEECGE